jgi:hypothetical protein
MTSKRSEIEIAIKIQLNINSSGFSGYFIILILTKFIIAIKTAALVYVGNNTNVIRIKIA